MDVSIIIVNYNTVHLLVDAIDSVFDKTEDIEYEIIVVDNNSTDNSRNILAEKYGNKVTYMCLSENIGFGRANNEGAKIAKGRNLFLLNPDTILLNNAVKILSDYLDNNHDVGCCGGNLYDINGKPIHSFTRFFGHSLHGVINQLLLGLPAKIIYGKNLFNNRSGKPIRVAYITGADLMIRKELFDKLKGFDPDFFMYEEEVELEYRLNKKKFKAVSVPYARIVHLEGKSFANKFDKLECLFGSRSLFLKKTKGPIKIFIIDKIYKLVILSRLFIWNIFRNKEEIALWSLVFRITKDQSKKDI